MRSWIVEGSLDDENWTEIDRHTENFSLQGNWDVVSFTMSRFGEWRFIRLTQTDKTHYGTHFLSMDGFELFGTLLE
jgi:hypothetical protein